MLWNTTSLDMRNCLSLPVYKKKLKLWITEKRPQPADGPPAPPPPPTPPPSPPPPPPPPSTHSPPHSPPFPPPMHPASPPHYATNNVMTSEQADFLDEYVRFLRNADNSSDEDEAGRLSESL